MRISVCEYLRLMTQRNWFYTNPGHWTSERGEMEAFRVSDDSFQLVRGRRVVKELAYFQGLPSNVVRKQFNRTKNRRKK